MTKRRLRREHKAMRRHLALLTGLILLTELRLLEHDAAKRELGIEKPFGPDEIRAVRFELRDSHMPEQTKARMIFDELQEIDLYITAPFELFLTIAQSMLSRYRQLVIEDPTLEHDDLEQYLIENGGAIDALKTLRDWLLHPGPSRRTNEAVSMLYGEDDEPVFDHPYEIASRLLELFGEVTESLNERL